MNFREFFTTNSWWGKLLGAFFGFLSAGPAGAFFGILVGNMFDRGLSTLLTNPHWFYHAEKQKSVQKIFFKATFMVMGHVAKADGVITEQEIKMAKVLMKEMRLNKEQKEEAKQLFNEGKQPTFNLTSILSELKIACRENRDLLKLFVDIQYRASMVDGLSPKKIKALDTIFGLLGFAPLHQQYRFYEDFGQQAYEQEEPQPNYQQHRSSSYQREPKYSASSQLNQAYSLLEVEPSANKQEVKRAYRRMMSRNHPDKLIAQGLPQEMIKIANDKTQKILKAYELICQTKGW